MTKARNTTILLLILILSTVLTAANAVAEPMELEGLIEPSLVVNIGSSVPGILETVKVDRGDMVKKDEVVASLQAGVEKANLVLARYRAETKANIELKQKRLDYAKREKNRFEELFKKKALTMREMDEVETGMALAELELQEALESRRLAELDLKRYTEIVKRMTIRSPVNGVVVERFLARGEYVEDQPIFKVAQIDPLHIEVIATVEQLGTLRKGMKAEIRPENPHKKRYTAKVTIVDRVVDAASGTFGVRLELPNPDYKLPAGLKCTVVFLEKKAGSNF